MWNKYHVDKPFATTFLCERKEKGVDEAVDLGGIDVIGTQ